MSEQAKVTDEQVAAKAAGLYGSDEVDVLSIVEPTGEGGWWVSALVWVGPEDFGLEGLDDDSEEAGR